MELANSVFLYLVLLRFTPVASNSFSFPSLRSSYTATLSSTRFWIFLPSRIQSGEETDVGRQRLNHSSLSLSRFSELNKALDTKEYNWWRVFSFLPQELQTRSNLSSACNILFARITSKEPVCFEGWNKFSVPIWSPWETNFDTQTKRVPAWPVISQLWFPERHFSANGISLRLGEVQMKFYERSLQALLSSAPRGFAARSRVLERLASLAQIGELARVLILWHWHCQRFQVFFSVFKKTSICPTLSQFWIEGGPGHSLLFCFKIQIFVIKDSKCYLNKRLIHE